MGIAGHFRYIGTRTGKEARVMAAKRRRKTTPGTGGWSSGGRGNKRKNITGKMVEVGKAARKASAGPAGNGQQPARTDEPLRGRQVLQATGRRVSERGWKFSSYEAPAKRRRSGVG